MKKIVFVHLLNDYSGSPKVLSQVISAIRSKECFVELYTGEVDGDGFLTGLTGNHHFYFYKRFKNKYITLITFTISQAILFFKLFKYRNEDISIYINTLLPFGAALAGKLMGKSVYYHIHETSLTPASFKRFLRYIVKISAKKVIFVSKSVGKVERFKGIPQEVIYNALPNKLVETAQKSHYQWKYEGAFEVLMICSLKAYKGVNEFVSIVALCQKYKSVKFTLILNADQDEIDEYFNKIVLPSHLTLVSRQKNLVPYYKKTSLLLNLSQVDQWVETFGLTIIEAMAFGIPVIAPPVGGPVEIINHGKEGYLVSSYEINKIARIINELASNEEKCRTLSELAKKRSVLFREDIFEKKIQKVVLDLPL